MDDDPPYQPTPAEPRNFNTPMARAIATKVRTFFEHNPRAHDQGAWFETNNASVIDTGHTDDCEGAATHAPVLMRSVEDMDGVSCGTTMCVAGAACLAAGYILRTGGPHPGGYDLTYLSHAVHPSNPTKRLPIGRVARGLLDLTPEEAHALFHEATDAEALHMIGSLADTGDLHGIPYDDGDDE